MSEIRDVSTLPIARSAVDALIKGGFRFVSDLKGIQPLELSQELGIAAEVALGIIKAAETSTSTSAAAEDKLDVTAKDILTKYGVARPVITFCRQIDVMLGGGVPMGQITEFCGVPGVGKTQLGIQLALNVQIPEVFNGLGGEAVYIDTEGSFVVERVAEMAAELSNHLHKLARGQAAKNKSQDAIVNQISAAQSMTTDRFLEGIQIFRVHDQTETIATINHLAAYLKLHTKIRLVVIDSIAFHFRQDLTDTTGRSRVLSGIAQTLNQLAYEHSLAVVVMNHVTTRFERSLSATGGSGRGGSGEADYSEFGGDYATPVPGSVAVSGAQRLVPALGEQWSHCITHRVMLHWHLGRERRASLVKSPTMPFASVPYCVCERGIRDIPDVLARDKKRRLEETAAAAAGAAAAGQPGARGPSPSAVPGSVPASTAPPTTAIPGTFRPVPSTSTVPTVPPGMSNPFAPAPAQGPAFAHQDYHAAQQQQQQYQRYLAQQQQQQQQQQRGAQGETGASSGAAPGQR